MGKGSTNSNYFEISTYPASMAKIHNNNKTDNVGTMQGKENTYAVLMRVQIAAATMENQ